MSSIPKNEQNQKQVLTLNELSKRKVVEHNSLITSIAKMDKTPLKMFELAVSCIDTEKPTFFMLTLKTLKGAYFYV